LTDNSKATIGSEKVKVLFIDHLNRLYCAKSHLAERLPEIFDEAAFADLKHAIKETILHTEKQLLRIDQIFALMNTKYSFEKCQPLITFLENAFEALQLHATEQEFRDLMIVTYLYHLDSVELASSKILKIAANSLHAQQIKLLISENYSEAKAENALLLLLLKKTAR
jgi:ferritin-like metal-binding protein YciE